MKHRSAEIDIVKCIAMLMVVFSHMLPLINAPGKAINACQMPVMYFCSGFLAYRSAKRYSPLMLIRKKAITLAVPYVFWSIFSIAANFCVLLIQGSGSFNALLHETIEILFYARSVWFLIQLFFAFAVLCVSISAAGRRGVRFYCTSLVLYLALAVVLPQKPFALYNFKWLYPFFLLGYGIADKYEEDTGLLTVGHPARGYLALLSCSFPLLVYFVIGDELYKQYHAGQYSNAGMLLGGLFCYLVSMLSIIFVFSIAEQLMRTRLSEKLAEIGRYSLDIYVSHMFLIKFIPFPKMIFWVNDMTDIYIYILPFLIYSVLIVMFVWYVASRWLRKFSIYRVLVGQPIKQSRGN